MTTGGHVFTTWCVAHLLHPIIWIISASLMNQGLAPDMDMDIIFLICIVALFTSIPAILVFWAVIELITNSSFSPLKKLIIWVFCAPLIVGINAFLLMLIMNNGKMTNDMPGAVFFAVSPSVIATLLAVLIRCQQFLRLNMHIVNRKVDDQKQEASVAQP
jgi:hypothetical protein